MNPLAVSGKIKSGYLRYLRSTFAPRDRTWRAQFDRGLAQQLSLTKGPYLQATPAFERGATLRDLIDEGLLHPEFARIPGDVFALERPLHRHQEIAIRRVLAGRNLLVATGTGSGKTECVLFPTLELLLREAQAGTLGEPGVRALLLYPMNALANDQLRRLRALLAAYPEITFGRFVGDTETDPQQARDIFRAVFPGQTPLENELLSCEEMRARPPHILLTNFSMLEYLLLRLEDTPLFDGPTGSHWRLIALDEAHVYDGANGTEIALLLRRLRDRTVGSERGRLRCVATSATLGAGEHDYPQLAAFGKALFDERFEWMPGDPDRQDVIGPLHRRLIHEVAAYELPATTYVGLRAARDLGIAGLRSVLASACPAAVERLAETGDVGAALQRVLAVDARVIRLQKALTPDTERLTAGAMLLEDAAKEAFGDATAIDPLGALVELGVAARADEGDPPLVPARYHLWLRGLEGVFVCLHPAHPPDAPRLHLAAGERCRACDAAGIDAVLFELGTCRRCRAEYVVGRRTDKGAVRRAPVGANPSLYLLLGAPANQLDEDEAAGEMPDDAADEAQGAPAVWLCPGCGRILRGAEALCDCADPPARRAVSEVTLTDEDLVPRRCAACSGSSGAGIVGRFLTDTSAPAAVVATALYQELPTAREPHAVAKLGGGRKLLAFADSRQEAAFFAPYLERTYTAALRRSLILRAVETLYEGTPLRMRDLVGWLVDTASAQLVLDPADSPNGRRATVETWLLQELLALDRRQSLEGVGLVRCALSLPDAPAPAALAPLGLTEDETRALVGLLLDTVRASGVLTFPWGVSRTDPAFAPRTGDYVIRGTGASPRQQVLAWTPSRGSNRRRDLLEKVAKRRQMRIDPAATLTALWDALTGADSAWAPLLPEASDPRRGVVRRLAHERYEFTPHRPGLERYRCSACGQLWWTSVLGVCPTYRCDGTLEPVAPDEPPNHYAVLYQSLAPIAMHVEEHTAQWALERGTKIQSKFLDGDINVLSCSTTFELGVDVGDVEAVLLRNVPPSPANYVQRAGRAGRRADAASMVVTLAQRRNHDLFWFRDPRAMIEGIVTPPQIVLDNPVIGRRHAHSVALAAWLRREPDMRRAGDFLDPDASGKTGDARFLDWLRTRPDEVRAALGRILPTSVAAAIDVEGWGWVEALAGATPDDPTAGWLDRAVTDARDDLAQIRSAIEQAIADGKPRLWDALNRQVATITHEPLINFLARRNVLPKYGFPVDVVPLDLTRTGVDEAAGIKLDRDLRLAISEYAPGSEVVAAKMVWRSIGLKRHPERDWRTRDWAVCAACGRYRDALSDSLAEACDCGSVEVAQRGRWVAPIFGFVGTRSDTDVDESPAPRRSSVQSWFSEYGAGGEPPERAPEGIVPGRATTLLARQGRIVVLNSGPGRRGFRICEWCGWGEPVPLRPPRGKAATRGHHNPLTGAECNHAPSTRQLGHDFLTDLLEVRVAGTHKQSALRSALYALLEGAGRLGIKRDEIDGTLHTWRADQPAALVLYDTVPGGAGHAKRIDEHFARVVDAALERVRGCECGRETSCYACLRSYSNQLYHDELVRSAAEAVLRTAARWLTGRVTGMRRFATRSELEKYLAARLAGHRLVCEIDWEQDILQELHALWALEHAGEYPAMTLLRLVQYGAQHYEANDFWSGLGFGPADQRTAGRAFEDALNRLGLETFPQFVSSERAKRFVSVILAHGGLPATVAGRFLRQSLLPALRHGEADTAAELAGRWRSAPPAYFPQAVRRFLLYGGEVAVDLLDRLIALAAVPRAELAAHLAEQGLPTYLVRAFLEVPEAEVQRAVAWPRPTVELDPWASTGPVLRLPRFDEAPARGTYWEIDAGTGTTQRVPAVHGSDPAPIPLVPAPLWRVTARGTGNSGKLERSFAFEGLSDELPLVCFDEHWRHLRVAGGLRAERLWVVAPRGVALVSVEAGALRDLEGETTAACGGAWTGHAVTAYLLTGVDLLAVLRDKREIARLPVARRDAGVELVGTPVRDVLGREGDPAYAEPPAVSLPPGSAWRVRLDDPDGPREQLLPSADLRRTVDLRSLSTRGDTTPTAFSVGRYELTVQGERLGSDLRRAFVYVPGLGLATPDEPCPPETGAIAVRVEGAPGVRFFRHAGATEVTVEAGDTRAALLVQGHDRRHRAWLFVSVPRLRWALRGADGSSETLAQTIVPLIRERVAEQTLVVSLGRPRRPVRLLLEGPIGPLLEVPRKASDAWGQVDFPLASLRDTLRAHTAEELRLFVQVGAAPSVLVARHAVPAPTAEPNAPTVLGTRREGVVREFRRHALMVGGDGWSGVVYEEQLPRALDTYHIGDSIEGIVTRIEAEGQLRLDACTFDPAQFKFGTQVDGRVRRRAADYLLVDLGSVAGRVFQERLPRSRPLESWASGELVRAHVVNVDRERRLVDLAIIPFAPGEIAVGEAIEGLVVRRTDGGVSVSLGDGLVGFLPRRLEPDGPRPAAGSWISGWVERVDAVHEQLVLSCRPFNAAGFAVGDRLAVTVRHTGSSRLEVTMPDGTSGVIPRSALPPHLDVPDGPSVGQHLTAVVTRLDAKGRRITLSVRATSDSWTFGAEGPSEAQVQESPFAALQNRRWTRRRD
jgi:hypothetical protein